jgi:hypothetical protein
MTFLSQFDALHEQAVKACGFDDFGPTDYVEPLKLLLSDYDRYCHFSEIGAQITAGAIVGHLVGRLFAQHGFTSRPELMDTPIERPIIITGMMRTGSTALQRLLSQGPDLQSLPFWLTSTPMPRPPRETWESHPLYQQTVQNLSQFYQLLPDVKQSHPILAGEADECHYTTSQSFWCLALALQTTCPEYREWLWSADPRYSYERHRKVLALVSGGDRRRWLLKDPMHLAALDTLLDVFPDACVVYTHRDPLISLPSSASLVYQVRKMREPELTPAQHGKEMLSLVGRAQAQAEVVRKRSNPAQFCDVHINELNTDPVGTAERIYRHFNIPISDATRQSWQQHAKADPKAGHGAHHYTMADFGFSATDIYDSIGDYRERYQLLYGNK